MEDQNICERCRRAQTRYQYFIVLGSAFWNAWTIYW